LISNIHKHLQSYRTTGQWKVNKIFPSREQSIRTGWKERDKRGECTCWVCVRWGLVVLRGRQTDGDPTHVALQFRI